VPTHLVSSVRSRPHFHLIKRYVVARTFGWVATFVLRLFQSAAYVQDLQSVEAPPCWASAALLLSKVASRKRQHYCDREHRGNQTSTVTQAASPLFVRVEIPSAAADSGPSRAPRSRGRAGRRAFCVLAALRNSLFAPRTRNSCFPSAL
jgi:hypothetical protein